MCLECFFAALSALSFPCMPIWLGIQVRMMLLLLEKVFILSSSLVMRGVDESLLWRAWKTDLESEKMNLEDLWFAIMFMARSIAMTSALQIENSLRRRFNSSGFWKTAAQPTHIPCLDPSVAHSTEVRALSPEFEKSDKGAQIQLTCKKNCEPELKYHDTGNG